jgi:hypothetical protein
MNNIPSVTSGGIAIVSLQIAVLLVLLIAVGLYTRKWLISGA